MERAISVGDFETPLNALKAGLHRGDIAILSDFGLHEGRHVALDDANVRFDAGKSIIHARQLCLNGLQVLKDQFVRDVLAHGRTIPAIGDASNCLPSHISNPPEGPPPSDRGGPAGLSLSQSSQDRSAALSIQEPMAPA